MIVEIARSWIGTPFKHHHEQKGYGCDCAGLIRGVCAEAGLLPKDVWSTPGAEKYKGYGRVPDGNSMRAACEEFMDPISEKEMAPGDVILIKWEQHPQHVGFIADYRHGGLSIIHALGPMAPAKVVEHRLLFSPKMKFVGAYRLRSLV